MRIIIFFTTAILFITSGAVFAKENAKAVVGYKCTSKSGKTGVGTGRLSKQDEYSPFLRKTVQEGEYVIFRFDNQGREYWFSATNCTRI